MNIHPIMKTFAFAFAFLNPYKCMKIFMLAKMILGHRCEYGTTKFDT